MANSIHQFNSGASLSCRAEIQSTPAKQNLFLRALKPLSVLGGLCSFFSPSQGTSLRGASNTHRSLQYIETTPLPISYNCRLENYLTFPTNISDSALCQDSKFGKKVTIEDHGQFIESSAEDNCFIGEGAQVYRSHFGGTTYVQPESLISDIYVQDGASFGNTALQQEKCFDETGIKGVQLSTPKTPWEVQGALQIGSGISLELIEPLLANISRVLVDGEDSLRVIPGNLTIKFIENCTQVQLNGTLITPDTVIEPINSQFAPTYSDQNMNITGSIPQWVVPEGQATVKSFIPSDIIQSLDGQKLNYILTTGEGAPLNWVFLDIARERIVFYPIDGLLGDESVEEFAITLRATNDEDKILEVNGTVVVPRLDPNCQLTEEVIGDGIDPISGIGRYISCQGSDLANRSDQRLYLLKLALKSLAIGTAVGGAIFATLCAAAVVRDKRKLTDQKDLDQVLHYMLTDLLKNDPLNASKDWDKTVVQDIFSELRGFLNQRGALRHVRQYRNEVFKTLNYALAPMNSDNMYMSAFFLRNFLPLKQKITYGLVRSTIGCVGIDGSVEDIRSVVYTLRDALTTINYDIDVENLMEPGNKRQVKITDDPLDITQISQRLANRLTLLNLPFIAGNKVRHFWPLDGAIAERKIWTNALYGLLYCNIARRKESKEIDSLARSDMARMLSTVVADVKQRDSTLRAKFYSISSEIEAELSSEEYSHLDTANKDVLRRELILNSRVTTLLFSILDPKFHPKKLSKQLLDNPINLNIKNRFNPPATVPEFTSYRHSRSDYATQFDRDTGDIEMESLQGLTYARSLEYSEDTDSIIAEESIVDELASTETKTGHRRTSTLLTDTFPPPDDGRNWFEMMNELNASLTADSLDIEKVLASLENY